MIAAEDLQEGRPRESRTNWQIAKNSFVSMLHI